MKILEALNLKDDIIESFNKIALLDDKWDHKQHYEKMLLKEVLNCNGVALDIGCGTGEFAFKLSKKIKSVSGIDLSPVMIKEAIKRHSGENIKYSIQDFDQLDEESKFDYVVSIATFHHLCLESTLPKIERLLNNNGKLLVLDLYERKGFIDKILDCVAVPSNYIVKMLKNGRRVDTKEIEAWEEHSHLDKYMTFNELSNVYHKHLSGDIKIQRLLFWRYVMIYKKSNNDE